MPRDAKIIEPRWARRRDDRPHELIAAALALFVENGFTATRMEDVAQRAGVSKGTLYKYFGSKEALLKAAVRDGLVDKFVEAEVEINAYEGSSAMLLKILVRRWWNEIGSTRLAGISKLMTAEARNFPELATFYHVEVLERGYHLFELAIARGVAQGEFREVDMRHVARIAAAPLLMLSIWRHSFVGCGDAATADPAGYIETHIDLLLASLAPRAASIVSKPLLKSA